jgi:hypothetical protein
MGARSRREAVVAPPGVYRSRGRERYRERESERQSERERERERDKEREREREKERARARERTSAREADRLSISALGYERHLYQERDSYIKRAKERKSDTKTDTKL